MDRPILGSDDLLAEAGVAPVTPPSSGTVLLPFEQLGAVLDVCERRGIGVLGIEGFELVPGGHRPRMDAILDLSDSATVEESIGDARRFVAEFADVGLVAEIEFDL